MIFAHITTDRSQLIVCGNFWPGFTHGAPPPAWWPNTPIHDHRTGATCPTCSATPPPAREEP